jgi:hypothetical protein
MPSRRSRTQSAIVDPTQNRAQFREHLEKLGLPSESEYRKWCKKHNLGHGIFKTGAQKRRELQIAELGRNRELLARRRGHTRKPHKTLRQLHDGELSTGQLGADYLYVARTEFEAFAQDAGSRRAFLDLLLVASEHGKLFGLEPALRHLGPQPTNRFMAGLAQLARHHEHFVRPAEAWRPESRNPRRQFGQLSRHLLATYPDVPGFMDAAWFGEPGPDMTQQQQWFLHLGAGGNIRTAPECPVALTKRMAHEFLSAPEDLTIPLAIRWAQVIGQGGDEPMARAVMASRLGQSFEEEEFWSSVVVFFVRNPMLDPSQVGPIIDFAQNQKFEPEERFLPDGTVEHQGPPQPNLAMKSRSVEKLLSQVDAWHEVLNQRVVDPFAEGARPRAGKRWQNLISWDRCGIEEFDHEETNTNTGENILWMIRELCSNRALVAEGRAMAHCVASYEKSCRNGNTTIWSLSARVNKTRSPVLTIAVDPRTRAITQMRGKFNAGLDAAKGRQGRQKLDGDRTRLLKQARPVLEHWVKRERLQMK